MAEAALESALLCRVGNLLCALPLQYVVETMRPLPVEEMPDTPDFVAGMSLVRGSPVPVIALARLFNAPADRPTRLVIIRSGGRRVGVIVDAVLGIHAIAPDVFRRLPPLLRDASRRAVAEIGALDGEFTVALSAARLVPEEIFARVEKQAAAS